MASVAKSHGLSFLLPFVCFRAKQMGFEKVFDKLTSEWML